MPANKKPFNILQVRTTANSPEIVESINKIQQNIKEAFDSLNKTVDNVYTREVTISGLNQRFYHGLGHPPEAVEILGMEFQDPPFERTRYTNTERAYYIELSCSGVNRVKLRVV